MKKLIRLAVLCTCLCVLAQAKDVTLTVAHPAKMADEVSVSASETAQVTSSYGTGSGSGISATIRIIKDGITNSLRGDSFYQGGTYARGLPLTVAGPATVRLTRDYDDTWFCTVKIEPETFPPGQTIILPEGTVGVIHVESSTNLVQWQDEWVHTFSNTNQNRFFRLRAERSLP